MSRSMIILVTLVAYKLVLIGIGWWAQRRTGSVEDFFVGGRHLGPWVASLSYAASSSSAWTLLGVSGAAFTVGVGALWMLPGILGCHLIAWFWIAPRLRQLSGERELMTLTEVLAMDASPRATRVIALLASMIIVFCFVFYVASQFQAAGKTFEVSFGTDPVGSIALGALIILIYTLLGGFWAVSVTDALQGGLMALAAILLPIAALVSVGGFAGLTEGLAATATVNQLSWHAGWGPMLGLGFIFGLMLIGLGTFGQPHLMNRFMALESDRALRRARIMALVWFAVVLSGMLLLGLCGRVLVPEIVDGETVFFQLTDDLLPLVLGAIVTAAVLSAVMSTADSQLLVTAAAVSNDVGLFDRRHPRGLLYSRLAMVAVSVLAVLVAITLPATIFARVLFAWNGLGSAFGPLLFARLAGRSLPPVTVITAMVSGFGLTALFYSLRNSPGDIVERAVPFVISAIIVWAGSRKAPVLSGTRPA